MTVYAARIVCWFLGHVPVAFSEQRHSMNVDWTFGRAETWTGQRCSRCGVVVVPSRSAGGATKP